MLMDYYLDPTDYEVFNGTTLDPLPTELKYLIVSAFNDVVDEMILTKQVECYEDHHLLGLRCNLPCYYCGTSTGIWHCYDHPYCAECVCKGPIPECTICADFQKESDYLKRDYSRSDQFGRQEKHTQIEWIDKQLNEYGYYIFKIKCPLCYETEESRGKGRCAVCKNRDDLFDIKFCHKLYKYPQQFIHRKNDGIMRTIMHQTYFGLKEFLVCQNCIDGECIAFDKSITII